MKYRGYEINRELSAPIPGEWWTFAADDYDGPEDDRSGIAVSIACAKNQIDLLEDTTHPGRKR